MKCSVSMTIILCHKCHILMCFKILGTFQEIWDNCCFTCILIFLCVVRVLMIFMSWEGQVNKSIDFNFYAKRHSHSEYRNRKTNKSLLYPKKATKECQVYNFSDILWSVSMFVSLFVYFLVWLFVLNRGKLPRPLACQPASICQHP